MTTDADTEKKPVIDSLGATESWLTPLAKVGAAIVILTYLLGFLVTAWRLSEYGITLSRLVDIQYLVAGTIPMIVLLMMIAAVSLGWHFAQIEVEFGAQELVLAAIVTVLGLWMYGLGKRGQLWVPADELERQMTQFVTQGPPWWFFAVGWIVLWAMAASTKKVLYLTRILKAKQHDDQQPVTTSDMPNAVPNGKNDQFSEAKSDKDDGKRPEIGPVEKPSQTKVESGSRCRRIQYLLVLLSMYYIALVILGVAIISTLSTIGRLYLSLPQAVGGGSPMVVEMYVDGSKVPP